MNVQDAAGRAFQVLTSLGGERCRACCASICTLRLCLARHTWLWWEWPAKGAHDCPEVSAPCCSCPSDTGDL
eukprot:1868510-Amphidinium_carterae.1